MAGLILLLCLIPITFLSFAEVTHEITHSLHLPDPEDWYEFAFSMLFFPIIVLFFPMVRNYFPPEFSAREHPDRSCRVLIIFLSPAAPSFPRQCPDLSTIHCDLTQGDCSMFCDSPWRMPFQAIAEQLAHKRLERILLIASSETKNALEQRDVLGTHHEVPHFRELLHRLLPDGVTIPVDTPTDLGIAGAEFGVDFTAADRMSAVVEQCYHHYRRHGFLDADILLDITGGRVTPSIVGAMAAFHGGRRWQYVAAGKPVRVWKMSCLLAGSHVLRKWTEDLPEEILPGMETYMAGSLRLRVYLASMLTTFHWMAVDIRHLLGAERQLWQSLVSVALFTLCCFFFQLEIRRGRLRITAVQDEPTSALVLLLSQPNGALPEITPMPPSAQGHSDFRYLGGHNWRTPLEAIRIRRLKGRLRAVFVVCSAESSASYSAFAKAALQAFGALLKVEQIKSTPDFFSPVKVVETIEHASRDQLCEFRESVTVDVTGGTKLASLAAASVALGRGWVIQVQNPSGNAGLEERCYKFRYAYAAEEAN